MTEPSPPRVHTFVVAAADAGQRIDRLVVVLLGRAAVTSTRAQAQRWIGQGRVLVDGEPVRNRTTVAAGAEVRIEPGPDPLTEALPEPAVRFALVYEDDDLAVVDKPAGLVVHPSRGHRTGTLVNGLLGLGSFAAAGADPRDPEGHLRPGIVHRLDKDTSGLLVVAKRPAVREALKALLAAHDVERSYLAIVVGAAREATYDTAHGRHPHSRVRFTSKLAPDRPGARRAVTHVEPLRPLAGGAGTLVRCRLETGRTHQIRVHLAEQSATPVLGDPLYGRGPADPRLAEAARRLGRQALHAAVLGFVHPVTGRAMRWESPLPDDLERALAALSE